MTVATKPPICPYCDRKAVRVSGRKLLPRHPLQWGRWFYLCAPCGAYVGTHARSGEPFGRLANAELRRLRQQAHEAFDPLWRSGAMTRNRAYALLAERLSLPVARCHIGDFNEFQCRQAIDVCRRIERTWRAG